VEAGASFPFHQARGHLQMFTRELTTLFRVAALATAFFSPLAGAQARSLSDILSSGELHVGVNPNYPPAALYDDKNELAGFDVDVANLLAKMLDVKVSFVVVDPASRITFLASDKIDYVMAGMTRTPARAKVIDFTVPVNTEAFALVTTDKQSYASVNEMNDENVTFAEVRGTTPVTFIEQSLPKAYRAVRDGRATAVVEEGASMQKEMKRLPDVAWKLIPGEFGPVSYDCAGVSQGNDSLRHWLNVAIFSLQSDGTIDDLWRKWYGADMTVKVVPQPYF
jgi:polar amino acid transport system substrate-binding protein